MQTEFSIISIQYHGQIRILVSCLDTNILDDSDRSRRFVVVCENLSQAKLLYPNLDGELLTSISMDSIRKYVTDGSSSITLGDVSRLHNDLMSFLEIRNVVPLSVSQKWETCADELLQPINALTSKVCTEGLRQGLATKEILLRFAKAQDEIQFIPSEAFIECSKLALEFIESALYLDQPSEQIMPYCLVPTRNP